MQKRETLRSDWRRKEIWKIFKSESVH